MKPFDIEAAKMNKELLEAELKRYRKITMILRDMLDASQELSQLVDSNFYNNVNEIFLESTVRNLLYHHTNHYTKLKNFRPEITRELEKELAG